MSGFGAIYSLARADFLERVRRFSFLVVLGVTIVFGYTLVPPASAPYNGFVMSGCRGVYTSAWIGSVIGLSVASMLSLLGFYLVRDAVSRDYRTRVGQIIATTPISRFEYMIGKWLSNLAVFTLIIAILTVVALVMQLVRAEDSSLNLWKLAAPIWLMSFPVMAWVAALAVMLETVPLLRGALGYIGYIALWGWIMMFVSLGDMFEKPGEVKAYNDFIGVSASVASLAESMNGQGLDLSKGTTDIYQPTGGDAVPNFQWDGVRWGISEIFGRMLWFAGSLGVVLVTALFFDRFDPARRSLEFRKRKKRKRKRSRKKDEAEDEDIAGAAAPAGVIGFSEITPLEGGRRRPMIWTLTLIELRMLLRGRSWWWYMGALGLIISAGVVPKESVRILLYAIAWAWPTMIWSQMGCKERLHQAEALVYSAAGAARRQLPAAWLAGALLALIMGSGYGLRILITGKPEMFAAMIAGAMFVSALALALGTWTGGSKAFQILYPVLCYLGLSGKFVWFDFKGVNIESIKIMIPIYLSISVFLVTAISVSRMKQ